MPETLSRLCHAHDKTFWPWLTWADFSRLPDKKNYNIVIPIAGLADWGLGHALDAEETVLMRVLAAACEQLPETNRLLVIPPLRFVVGADAGCAFTVDVPTALKFIDEVCVSVAAAGFRRVILLNASPWSEELIDAAARDIRIERGLQMFCINLSALNLDFHPVRSRSRHTLQTLITALNGVEPVMTPDGSVEAPSLWNPERVTPLRQPALGLSAAKAEGATILAEASEHLAKLFAEIFSRPSLPRDGALVTMSAS